MSTLVSHIPRSGHLALSDNSCKQQANTDCLALLSTLSWHLDCVKKEDGWGRAFIATQTRSVGPEASWPLRVFCVGGRKDLGDLSFHLFCQSLLDSLAFPPL